MIVKLAGDRHICKLLPGYILAYFETQVWLVAGVDGLGWGWRWDRGREGCGDEVAMGSGASEFR